MFSNNSIFFSEYRKKFYSACSTSYILLMQINFISITYFFHENAGNSKA